MINIFNLMQMCLLKINLVSLTLTIGLSSKLNLSQFLRKFAPNSGFFNISPPGVLPLAILAPKEPLAFIFKQAISVR